MLHSTWRRFFRRTALAAALGAFAAGLTVVTPLAASAAAAGTLQQVSNFGSNPGNLAMYEYAPSGLPAGAPLVVALHGCTQSASDYHANSGWQKFADQWGFAVVYPQTSAANNSLSCFSWFDSTKDTRGNGEAASVKQMVDTAVAQYGSDRSRIFVTGLSAGGGMTADLLADYPDVFAGGSVDSGIPAQCATTQTGASGCQYSSQNLTPQQWGDKVRNSDPGYSGPWPRVAVWQGTSDTTVAPVNGTELRDQWTDVRGIGQTASSTQTLTGGTTESIYDDATGKPAVALFSVSGMAHGLAVNPGSGADQCGSTGTYYLNYICSSYYTAKFWGLDGSGGQGGTGSLPAPSGLTVTGTTDTGVSLSWNSVSGAASYNIYRDGTMVGSATGTTYTDTGLSAGTAYGYTVAAVDSSGAVGASSASVTATTTGSAAQCYTDNNYNQVQAGRAHQSGGYTYADGSDENMGLYNVAVTHTLTETSPGYFVIADSGC
ncbi:extracellular catalytic domain type 1 short-chain-length polyhydroxyalkanoate depolymerase [Streptomyces broussonetiae]|uniref:PHB depolymerase family esterase n=1 Tax=Streptomyces broussonetiae TaxID=2686304 RepID=A0A6I6NFF5_9ACTN|nr:PHB depolymerase family esterase [Streptomyces broussonetiae]QHA09071.1 PHB depolymerase family esterase [Streptomyces broussonetiae]